MFNSKTVFVVGAGASKEAGLPIGSELTTKIADLVNLEVEFDRVISGDQEIYKALVQLVRSDTSWGNNDLLSSGEQLADAMRLAQSIDTFLQSHSSNREFVLLGKLGIVRAIGQAEAASLLASRQPGEPSDLSKLSKTWYYSLARMLFNGVPADEPHLAFANVSFIVFNYDRCLEVFLIRAAEMFFRLSRAEAIDLIRRVSFVHPYGSLGDIFLPNGIGVPFASKRLDLLAASGRIKTFSEQSELRASVQKLVYDAEKLIFLGFGFHEQNMELLDISQDVSPTRAAATKQIYATTHGLSDSDEEVVRSQLSHAFHGMPIGQETARLIATKDATCAAFFDAYWRSLAA
jgi:hypothetical protein